MGTGRSVSLNLTVGLLVMAVAAGCSSQTAPPGETTPAAVDSASASEETASNQPSTAAPEFDTSTAPPATGVEDPAMEPTSSTIVPYSNEARGVRFTHPTDWVVTPTESGDALKISNEDGELMAQLIPTLNLGFRPCEPVPYELVGSIDAEMAEPAAVVTEILDYTAEDPPQSDGAPVQFLIQLYGGGVPDREAEACNVVGGFKNADSSGLFQAAQDFQTMEEAHAYTSTEEYEMVRQMISSLRLL